MVRRSFFSICTVGRPKAEQVPAEGGKRGVSKGALHTFPRRFFFRRTATDGGTIPAMDVGVPVRVHSLDGDDLGIAHLPPAVGPGDLVALEHAEYRVVDIVETGQADAIAALVKVMPAHLRLAAH